MNEDPREYQAVLWVAVEEPTQADIEKLEKLLEENVVNEVDGLDKGVITPKHVKPLTPEQAKKMADQLIEAMKE